MFIFALVFILVVIVAGIVCFRWPDDYDPYL